VIEAVVVGFVDELSSGVELDGQLRHTGEIERVVDAPTKMSRWGLTVRTALPPRWAAACQSVLELPP
jgi:hypothetical protein